MERSCVIADDQPEDVELGNSVSQRSTTRDHFVLSLLFVGLS